MIHAHGEDFGQTARVGRYFNRRIGRIVPIYWLVTLIYSVTLVTEHRAPELWHFVRSLLFLPGPSRDQYGWPVLGQGWTLNYEMIFYVIFGLTLFINWGPYLLFIFFIVSSMLHVFGLTGHNTPLDFWSSPITLYFLAGIGLGLVRRRFQAPYGFYTGIGLAALILAAAMAAYYALGPGSWISATSIICAAVGSVGACVLGTEKPIHRHAQGLAASLGAATYAVYLSHTLVISPFARLLAHRVQVPLTVFVPVAVVVCFAFGLGVNWAVEKPLLNLWRRLTEGKNEI